MADVLFTISCASVAASILIAGKTPDPRWILAKQVQLQHVDLDELRR